MADTIREQIIAAFVSRAAPLSTLPIERARRARVETDEKYISVWDGDETAIEQDYNRQRMQFAIALQSTWKYGSTNPSVAANALLGAIIQTMMIDSDLGGLAESFVYNTGSPLYPAEGSDYVTFAAGFLVTYATVRGDPFTAA